MNSRCTCKVSSLMRLLEVTHVEPDRTQSHARGQCCYRSALTRWLELLATTEKVLNKYRLSPALSSRKTPRIK
jgi:hypothetical protein